MKATPKAKGSSEARADGMRIVVVASAFNGEIVQKLDPPKR